MNHPPVALGDQYLPATGGFLRLNLGGRSTRLNGFLTVDLEPGSDIQSDVSDLTKFADHSVDEIYASHVLEHFPHPRTGYVLEEWRRVLKGGHKAFISVPDFDMAVKFYQQEGMVDFIRNLLWGDQGYPLAYHYTGFTFPTLAKLLMEAGFKDAKRIREMPYHVADCSHNVDNHYGRPISLNVEATA
jgi:predicted SAM-dependent methyltransferase